MGLPISVILRYNISDGILNVTRIRIAFSSGKVLCRAFSFDNLRHQKLLYLKKSTNGCVVHILSPLDMDRKYRQELKRGHYNFEKAKKYFP